MKKSKHNKERLQYKNKRVPSKKKNSYLQIEDIIKYLQQNKLEQIYINDLCNNFSIKSDRDYNTLLNKLSILVDINILSTSSSNDILCINRHKQFAIVSVHDNLNKNQLLVSYVSLFTNDIKDNIVVQLNNKSTKYNPLKAKTYNVLSEIKINSEQEIILDPLFYLYKNSNASTSLKKDKEFETVFIKQSSKNEPIIIPLSFSFKDQIRIKGLPNDLEDNSIIKIKLLMNKQAEYISTITSFSNNNVDYNKLTLSQFDIKNIFTNTLLEEADKAAKYNLNNRKDVTNLPFVTIDGEDSKDFDDAIYAEKIEDKEKTYNIYVAIADVSYYVSQDSEIDKEAQKRGNSIYLPGMVVPMLPEILSNDLCSLKPNVERGCLLATIEINRNGLIESYKFERALMKSKARLTYTEVQNALLGNYSDNIEPYKDVLSNIHEAYKLLYKARLNRQALIINSKETKINLDDEKNITSINIQAQATANEIVEEFMIAANVAAAKFIAKNNFKDCGLAIYRTHEKPTIDKIQDFKKILHFLKIKENIPNNIDEITGEMFNKISNKYKSDILNISLTEAILRAQSPAKYSNNNIGHFGLNLKEYCHFTSPIRRYSDLMIHRLILSIIDSTNNVFNYTRENVSKICDHICATERQAFVIENISKNRYIAKWYENYIDGSLHEGYISTITNAGMFIHLYDTQASGLLPCRLISSGYTIIDIEKKIVKDSVTRKTYKLGDKIQVAIHEANPITGLLTFKLNN